MRISKNDILIQLLKNVEADVPSEDFTGTIMEQLQTNIELDLASDELFSDVVNLPNAETPSSGFTEGIISSLKPKVSKTTYRPLIGKKVGLVFASVMLLLIILSFITNKNLNPKASETSVFDILNTTVSTFFDASMQNTMTVLLCIVSISTLLSIDFIYKKRYL